MEKFYKRFIMIIVAVFVFGVSNTIATRLYVSTTGDNSDGTSWTKAYTDLQSALGVATSGDTIVVAKGTYIPDASLRDKAFEMVAGVRVFGGFAGNEEINQTTIDNRNFETNETILSGDLLGNGSYYLSDNSYTIVVFDAWTTAMNNNTILDGFTISGGYANISSGMSGYGAGIYMKQGYTKDCNPLLRNLVIKNNKAKSGAGIYMSGISGAEAQIAPTLENIIFESNYAYDGGGGAIYMSALPSSVVDPVLKQVAFINNEADGSGGAVFLSGGVEGQPGTVTSTFTNVTFYGNICTSNSGTAIYIHGQEGLANPTFNNVIFYGNDDTQISRSASTGGSTDPSYNHCLITGSPSTNWNSDLGNNIGGNIDADPLLADPENGNLDIVEGSPVLNAGDATFGNNIGYYQGAGITEPTVTVVEDLVDFGTVEVGATSAEQTFTVSGVDLLNTVVITLPEGFEASQSSGAGFFNPLNLFNSGSIITTTIYVRFNPSTIGEHSGNIVISTPGTDDQLFPVSAYAGGVPEISTINNQTACKDGRLDIAFTITDDDLSTITTDLSISNETILPKENTEITGSNGSYNLAIKPTNEGNVSITILVSDANSNDVSTSFDLNIVTGPTLSVDFTQRVCNDDLAEFTLSSSGGNGTINYNVNDAGYTSQTYYGSLQDGDYEIVAMDEMNCTDTSDTYTVSNPAIIVPTAEVTKQITCSDDNDATITMGASGGWGSFEYSIDGIDYQTNNTFTNQSAGDYQLYVRDLEGCVEYVYLEVINPTVLEINYIAVENQTVNIVAYGGWSPLMYALDDGAYQSESYFENITTGTYTAYVKDAEGCIVSDVVNVTSTGVTGNLSEMGLEIYPNPAKDFVYFDANQLSDRIEKLQIYNLTGEKLKTHYVEELQTDKIEISDFENGLYIIVVELENGKLGFTKIVKY